MRMACSKSCEPPTCLTGHETRASVEASTRKKHSMSNFHIIAAMGIQLRYRIAIQSQLYKSRICAHQRGIAQSIMGSAEDQGQGYQTSPLPKSLLKKCLFLTKQGERSTKSRNHKGGDLQQYLRGLLLSRNY